jgi:hypothetical protein
MQQADTLNLKFGGLCLIIAPLLFGASTFFWHNGEYGVTAATLIAVAGIFWVPALTALFGLVKHKMPWYYSGGLFIAIYGACLGGIAFALLGYFTTIFQISHQTYIKTLAEYPVSSGILIFWAGPLFPLSLLALGINLIRQKAVATWLGVLICLGGMVFPLGRIFRIELIAHLTDLLFAVPFIILGFKFVGQRSEKHLVNA